MSRAPVSIVIPVWNAWETTKACLSALRSTLGPRDQVIVVDSGSTDATADHLPFSPWVQALRRESNDGFGAACNAGAGLARHDALLFVHSDTIPVHRWIEPLVTALESGDVVATGPRTDAVGGQQVIDGVTYASISEMRRFARDRAEKQRGRTSPAEVLTSFCLAVDRRAFTSVGGFDEGYGQGSWETEDLCLRLTGGSGRLVVCEDAFVHHDGRRTFEANFVDWMGERDSYMARFRARHPGAHAVAGTTLVSACLITKDEEERLPSCLSSLGPFADEIVVYDTGSSDATVAVARDLGARVIEGYWDDDFSRARNAALEHCSGEWIAWLDADETLQVGDVGALRSMLARTDRDVDAYSVRIQNLTGVGVGSEFTHHASRLFRRNRCEWTGRLHEQVAQRRDHAPIRQADMDDTAWIRHTGYMDEAMIGRGKAERNLRVARAEVDDADSWDRGYSLTSLGRSLMLAGQAVEGLARVVEGLDATHNAITRRLAVRTAIDCTMELGRLDEALDWCDRLRTEGAHPNTADAFEASVRLARRDWEPALVLLHRVQAGVYDEDGFAVSPGLISAQRAQAYVGLNRISDAADALLSSLSDAGALDTHLGSLIDYMLQSGKPLEDLARAIPADRVVYFMAQLLQIRPDSADAALEACLGTGVDTQTVLATASRLAPRLPVERALVWSVRLRSGGHAFACPLVKIAEGDGPALLRARAAATAAAGFADERAPSLFEVALADATPGERRQIEQEAAQLCPQLLGPTAPAPVAG